MNRLQRPGSCGTISPVEVLRKGAFLLPGQLNTSRQKSRRYFGQQRPANLDNLRSSGGFFAFSRKGEIVMEKNYVYVISSTSGHYKIGVTNSVGRRLKELTRTQGPYKYSLFREVPLFSSRAHADFTERRLHHKFAHKRVNGEWFSLDANDLREMDDLLDEAARADALVVRDYEENKGLYQRISALWLRSNKG